jgi:hypothetical protein
MIKSAGTRNTRRGAASILAVAVLAILAIIMGTVFALGLKGHRMGERRSQQLQTLWLARSGLEMGAARLIADPQYAGGIMSPIPGSRITVKIRHHGDQYVIDSEARYAVETTAPLVRRLEKRFRLIGGPGQRRLQVYGSEL